LTSVLRKVEMEGGQFSNSYTGDICPVVGCGEHYGDAWGLISDVLEKDQKSYFIDVAASYILRR